MARLGATAPKPWKSSATIKLTTARSQLIRRTPLQRVIVALVKALDVVAIEALVTDLHPGTQRAHGRKFLDGEPDRLRCGRKAAIAQRLSCPALALAHEQLGGYAVVECHSLAVGRFCVHVEFYHGNRPERIVWTPSDAVVDMRLEDGNGLEVISALKRRRPDARAIILTGYGNIATAVNAVKLGAVDYLSKPVDADDVVAALLALEGRKAEPPENPMSADRVRWEHIQRIYELCGRNVSETARRLNMHRRTLQRILAKRAPK